MGRTYSQSGTELKRMVQTLVGMCETGVDLAWQEVNAASPSTSPLPENHPLVRTESKRGVQIKYEIYIQGFL